MYRLENPSEWCPPPKEYGGENIPECFALMLTDEMTGAILIEEWRGRNMNSSERIPFETVKDDLPICSKIGEVAKLYKEAGLRLEEKGLFFYPEKSGSIFMDYKIVSGRYYCRKGMEINSKNNEQTAMIAGFEYVEHLFNVNMTTEEALELARNIVNEWDWGESDVESKEQGKEASVKIS